jgi:hypothetical protein
MGNLAFRTSRGWGFAQNPIFAQAGSWARWMSSPSGLIVSYFTSFFLLFVLVFVATTFLWMMVHSICPQKEIIPVENHHPNMN